MGASSNKDDEAIEGELSMNDKSFMTTILQVLFNIKELRDYLKNEISEKKYLSYSLKELFQKRPSRIDWDKSSIEIIKILKKYYNLQMEQTPGKELIQILMVLKYEEKEKLLPNWEEEVSYNKQLFNNIWNEKAALNDILDINRDNFDTTLASNFFGILLTKRKFMNSNIMHFYNFYCVYEMNLPGIYVNMVNKRKIMHDNNTLPKLNLIDCIKEMQETKIQIYDNQQCFTEYYMFNAPNYLIFILNNQAPNQESYRGHILFEPFSDFSNVILNTQTNKFKLFAVINSKRYNQKNQKEKGGVSWFQNKEEDNKQYRALIADEGSRNFFYYNDNNNETSCDLEIIDENYFHNILIFSRINN